MRTPGSGKRLPAAVSALATEQGGDQGAGPDLLSPARRHLDGLLQRLEHERGLLRAWGVALPRWQQRYVAQAVPLFERRSALERQWLSLLERAHAGFGLGKAERGFLAGLIGSLAGPGHEDDEVPLRGADADAPPEGRVGEAAQQRADDRRGEDAAAAQRLRQALAAHLGLDPEDVDGIEVPEALLHGLRERDRMRQAHARGRHERKRAKARLAEADSAAAQPPAMPLRALYRRLAAMLHPDREPDPGEQARKTALMQRTNQAYRAGNLLELIELQQEIGALQPGQLQRMGEQGLRDYSLGLERQLAGLVQQRAGLEAAFRRDHGFDAGQRLDPERLGTLLARIKRQLADEIAWLESALRQLQDPEAFRHWLKAQRRHGEL